jgi:metallothiol transferase
MTSTAVCVSASRDEGGDMELEALDHVGINVSDVDRSVRWYRDVLGLRRVHEEVWDSFPAVVEANGSGVALFPNERTSHDPPARDPDDMSHIGFRTSREGLERAREEVRARGIEVHEGNYTIAWSIFFEDPDGHEIEITTYEPPGET